MAKMEWAVLRVSKSRPPLATFYHQTPTVTGVIASVVGSGLD